MPADLKFVIKNLLEQPSSKKYYEFKSKFAGSLHGRDPLFDQLFEMLDAFHAQYQTPAPGSLVLTRLGAAQEPKLLQYVQAALTDTQLPTYASDADFFVAIEDAEKTFGVQDFFSAFTRAQTALSKAIPSLGSDGVKKALDDHLADVHRIKSLLGRDEASTTSMLYGKAKGTGKSLREIYATHKDRQEGDKGSYYTLGVPAFEKMRMKDGDLVFIGGYTSHGKSIWLRYMAYRLVVEYGRNTFFSSMEMPHDVVRSLFAILHANNKDIFPNTPPINSEDWENGLLTEEQEDFIFNVADHDLLNNPAYGILYIDQPNKSKYRLSDLDAKLTEVEAIFPVQAVVPDYLTMYYPLESDRGVPTMADYNDMVKRFKSMCLTHRNARGAISPFIGVTGCQLSRPGLAECIKRDGIYDQSAIHLYTEIEKSADQLYTVLMTPDMKQNNKIRLQAHKNRGGVVVLEPADLFVNLTEGMTLSSVETRSTTETAELLRSLSV